MESDGLVGVGEWRIFTLFPSNLSQAALHCLSSKRGCWLCTRSTSPNLEHLAMTLFVLLCIIIEAFSFFWYVAGRHCPSAAGISLAWCTNSIDRYGFNIKINTYLQALYDSRIIPLFSLSRKSKVNHFQIENGQYCCIA